jgi:23S rRNA (adenine2503-C2)-methyltransferase
MSDLSSEMRDKLKETYIIDPLTLVKRLVSKDKTVKYLFRLQDGSLAESVLMHYDYGKSVCVSSQIGCNMGCVFCASGLLKKTRDLTSGEMVAQVLYIQRELDQTSERVSHVVIMGTGEPFDNYENTMDFMNTINSDLGIAIGARHITVSTCGLVDKIRLFAHESVQYNLAISLHAPNDELRNKLMPINKAYPLAQLMDAIHEYADLNNRRITFEYILLKDVNDKEEHVRQLAALIKGLNAYVNLIPYNAVDEHGFNGVEFAAAMHFYDRLVKAGVKCTLRQEHGADIDAACGQLRAKVQRGEYDDL